MLQGLLGYKLKLCRVQTARVQLRSTYLCPCSNTAVNAAGTDRMQRAELMDSCMKLGVVHNALHEHVAVEHANYLTGSSILRRNPKHADTPTFQTTLVVCSNLCDQYHI